MISEINQRTVKKKKILHISPHLGGGVGSVVLNWMEKDFSDSTHTIISLDKNNNNDWIKTSREKENVTIYDDCYAREGFRDFLSGHIIDNDIVIIHWWNHPLLYDIMVNIDFPACRVMIWNHVSSLFAPYSMTEKLVDFTDLLVFTSPVSYECDEIKNLSQEKKKKLDVIWSTVGVESFDALERIPHEEFIIGYTGTVDFGKLHPSFIDLCASVNLPDAKFVVCSGDSQQHLKNEAEEKEITNIFSFEGRVPSVIPYLAKYDVFGYPLQPKHFATCEQSIGEAMMAGAVPVVLGNMTERHIVKHMETGMIAESLDDYPKAIQYLYNNRDELARMAKNAQEYAKKQYDINQTINKWNELFNKVMLGNKRERIWDENNRKNKTPSELYIESIGIYATPLKDFMNANNDDEKNVALKGIKKLFDTNIMFYSSNKGSVLQYLQYFPEDIYLQKWEKLCKAENSL